MPAPAKSILTDHKIREVPRDGSGLGLWIVRKIADDLGAAIEVSGESGSNTIVRLSIPRRISEVSNAA
jgi:signal transduction histidine kinase